MKWLMRKFSSSYAYFRDDEAANKFNIFSPRGRVEMKIEISF